MGAGRQRIFRAWTSLRNSWWDVQQWWALCWENTMSHLIRLIGNLEAADFQGFVFVCGRPCQSRLHCKWLQFLLPEPFPQQPLFPICNLIRQTDRNSKHLRIKIASTVRIVHVPVPVCCVSAPVWLSCAPLDCCDNEALAAICNPTFYAVLRVIHHNHSLTNQLGKAFTQPAKIKENADSNRGAEQLLSAAMDCFSSLPLCSCFQVFPRQTWQRTLKITQMEKRGATQSGSKCRRCCWCVYFIGLKHVHMLKYKRCKVFLLSNPELLSGNPAEAAVQGGNEQLYWGQTFLETKRNFLNVNKAPTSCSRAHPPLHIGLLSHIWIWLTA